MWIRVVFERTYSPVIDSAIDIFCDLALDRIREDLFIDPKFRIRGDRRKSLTIYNLSNRETDHVFQLFKREEEGELIRKVYRFKTSKEEDLGKFDFAEPDFTPEYEKEIQEKGIDIKKFVGGTIEAILTSMLKKDLSEIINEIREDAKASEHPLTYESMELAKLFSII